MHYTNIKFHFFLLFFTLNKFTNAALAPVYYINEPSPLNITRRSYLDELGLKEFIVVVNVDVQSYGADNNLVKRGEELTPKNRKWNKVATAALGDKIKFIKSKMSRRKAKSASIDPFGTSESAIVGNFFCFSGVFDQNTLDVVRGIEDVKYIEEMIYITIEKDEPSDTSKDLLQKRSNNLPKNDNLNASQNDLGYEKRADSSVYYQRYAPWALSRISSRSRQQPSYPYGNGYTFKNGGEGVVVYVVDSGININHADFGGRASFGPNVAYNADGVVTEDGYDYGGHGTAVASMAIGTAFGAAKKAKAISYKISAIGIGFPVIRVAQVIQDIADLIKNADDGRVASVLVFSFVAGSVSQSWDDAAKEFKAMGHIYVVSAGNNRADACKKSPMSSMATLSIGSTDSSDSLQPTSNFGKCVDIYAPGVNVQFASHLNNFGSRTSTGTSYSAPLVAGICANILSDYPNLNLDQLKEKLLSISVNDAINTLPADSVNILAQAYM
ncbi:Subtilisin-like protease 8 [Smittium culicis]|uniref:Subtilisin-like protease 8 n=1 Tax=Smittium culicis TaxID=133412 RepID=A0A1R1XI98_9FUNG|nr:Subtilisin-like protease 8 [Smittium culicis]